MSLPGSQRQALERIEKTLREDDRQLCSLFATFTRLTSHEAMPRIETVTPRWQLRLGLGAAATAIGLAAVMIALLVSLIAPGQPPCSGRGAAATAYLQPFRVGQQASCPARHPAGTSHAAAGQS